MYQHDIITKTLYNNSINSIIIMIVVYIDNNKLLIITVPKTIRFNLAKKMNNSLKQEIDFVIKRNGFLAEERIKTRLSNYCLDIRAETIFMNTENSKTSEPHKFALSLQQRLDLKSSDKYVALQSLPIYYTWKNIRQQHKNNKLKVIISPI